MERRKRARRTGDYRPKRDGRVVSAWLAGIAGLVMVAGLVFAVAQHPLVSARSEVGLDVGAAVPALTLGSTTGSRISLSAYKGKKVILFFYEGAGCGPCQEQLVELENTLTWIGSDGGEVLAASTDTPAVSMSLAKQLRLRFPILFDTEGRMGSAFGVFDLAGGMNMGAVDRHSIFVINTRGKVSWKRISLNQMHVPVVDVLSALKSAS